MVELDLLGVDEHQPQLVRRGAQQHAAQHRVDRTGLARAGGARDEQVRHLREVGADRLAGHVLAEPHGQRRPVLGRRLVDVAEPDHPPVGVGNLDPHRLLAGDRCEDADVGGGERVREVILELGDLRDLGAGCEAQLVARDVRTGDRADHLRLHAEVPERLDQAVGRAALPCGVRPRLLGARARQQPGGLGQLPDEAGVVCGGLPQPPLWSQLIGRDRGSVGVRHTGNVLVRLLVGLGLVVVGLEPLDSERAVFVRVLPVTRGRLHVRGAHDQFPCGGFRRRDRRHELELILLVEGNRAAPARRPAARRRGSLFAAQPAHDARGVEHAGTRRADHARERGTGEQHQAGECQEHDEDLHPHALHEPVRDFVERLPGYAAVALKLRRGPGADSSRSRAEPERAGGERERDRGEQAQRACAQRSQRRQHRAREHHAACQHQRDGGQHTRAPERPAERHRDRVPGATAGGGRPCRPVQDETHEHTGSEERQPEHVALALVEHGHTRQADADDRAQARARAA